nr:MAG: replication initiator protein [Microvirus sp.]
MCNFSITLERNTDHERKVPCGRCLKCKKKLSAEWLFRLQHEVKEHNTPYYVTFTYNDVWLPYKYDKSRNTNIPSLMYQDLQKYFKRLRKKTKQNVRYFAVGEYGSKRGRPHYHAIIFNVSNVDDIVNCWSINNSSLGYVYVDKFDLSLGGGSYLTKYLVKDKFDRKKDVREPTKLLVSKGFGKSYLTESVQSWHNSNPYQNSYVVSNGQKVPIPRYLKDKIFKPKSEERELLTSAMQDLSRRLFDEKFRSYQKRYPKLSEDEIYKMIENNEISKNFSTFEKTKSKYYGKKSRKILQ